MDVKLKGAVTHLLAFFHINVSNKTQDNLIQFIKFGTVGVTNTIISYGLNLLVLAVMHPFNVSWDFVLGNVVAFILSVLWSFYWNNRFVFSLREGEHRKLWQALMKTYVAYAFTGIVLNNTLGWLWISILHISKYIAPLINLVISVPINFVINKHWAFK